jgi:hypothetical protein
MPCAEKDTSITAIVVQGTNQMDFAVDEDGTLVYPEGVSIAFDDILVVGIDDCLHMSFCVSDCFVESFFYLLITDIS